VPPQFLPPGKWSGSIQSLAEIDLKKGKAPNVQGNLNLQNLAGNEINLKTEAANLQGQLRANLQSQFSYDGALKVPQMDGDVDLSQLQIEAPGKLFKPQGVPMLAIVKANQAGENLKIEKADFQFATLKASVSGVVASNPQGQSDLTIRVPETSLAGFEKYITMLAGTPLVGKVATNASIKGNLQKPETLWVNLNPLKIEGLRGQIKYIEKQTKVQGPASLDLNGVIVAHGKDLQNAQVTLKSDLTQLEIQQADIFQKKTGEKLSINLNAKKKGQQLEITKGDVDTFIGKLSLSGWAKEPQSPVFDIKSNIPKLDLTNLARWVPPRGACRRT
jgi:hypothetical protein